MRWILNRLFRIVLLNKKPVDPMPFRSDETVPKAWKVASSKPQRPHAGGTPLYNAGGNPLPLNET